MKYTRNNGGLFSFVGLIPNLIRIAIYLAIYIYLLSNGLFPKWIVYISYATKILIAIEILLAAGKSLIGPLLALIVGFFLLYFETVHDINFVNPSDAWQLIVVAVVGIILTVIIKF